MATSTSFTFKQLVVAARQCARGVRWKDSIANWTSAKNIGANCLKLLRELESGTYKLSGYVKFEVNEPKRRIIRSPKFRDRVVQRAMCNNGLYQDLTRGNIYDNGACQIGKGTVFTMNRLSCHLQRYYRKFGCQGWAIKADISKFFDSIPHQPLKDMVYELVENKEYVKLVCEIIDSFDEPGIGLGSQISQLLAIAYLSKFDHYVKEKLHFKYYVRYSDDIVILHNDKNVLRNALKEIETYLKALGLKLNVKTQIVKLQQGIKFMKFRYCLTNKGRVIRILNSQSAIRIKRRIRKLKGKILNCERSVQDVENCFNAWKAHANLGCSHNKIRSVKKLCQGLFQGMKQLGNNV